MNFIKKWLRKREYQRIVDGMNLWFLREKCAHRIKGMSQEQALDTFCMICDMETKGDHPVTQQGRLDIAYTAGFVDERGFIKEKNNA